MRPGLYGISHLLKVLFLLSAIGCALPGLAQFPEALTKVPRYSFTSRGFIPDSFTPSLAGIKELLFTADRSLKSNRPDSARYMATLAWEQSAGIGYIQGIAHSLNTIGVALQQQGLHDSAIAYFDRSLTFAQKTGNKRNLYRLHLNLGTSYFHTGKYGSVLEHYLLALKQMERNNSVYTAGDSVALYCNIGIVWARLKAFDQSYQTLSEALEIAERAQDTLHLGDVYARIGEAHLLRQDWKGARNYYIKGLELSGKYNRTGSRIEILNSLAHLSLEEKNMEEAYIYTKEAMKLLQYEPDNYVYSGLHALHNLGMYYLERKQYRQAEAVLYPTLKRAEESGYKDIIPHMESDIARLYAATGRHELAYKHMLHYAMQKDTIFEEERSRSLDIWMKARMHEKDKELMAKQLFIARQENQLQSKNFLMIAVVAGSLLLIALFLAFLRSYRNKQKLQQSVIARLQQEQEISQLKAHVRGEEQERNRLARELHDGIASHLWAIKLNVDSLRQQEGWSGAGQRELSAIYKQLEDTTLEVRKTAHNLMPDLLLEEGLATALASFCERIGKQTDLEVDFMEYGIIPRMDEEIEISIYRMIQELVQNALKHAKGATALLVQISCTGNLLNITVEDNGIGFSGNCTTQEGIGLRYIRKRVAALQGHMDVQSQPSKGTTIYIEFDIQHLL